MKKTLFSLLILSGISLSNQAIAEDYQFINNQSIDISGEVIYNAPTCTLENIAPIELVNVNHNEIDNDNANSAKVISIKFSNCTNFDSHKEISLSLVQEESSDLKNIIQGDEASNVLIQIFDEDDFPLSLNKKNNLSMKKDIIDGNAEFILKANYKKPVGEEVKAGKVASKLVFNAYINDDISE